MTRGIDRLKTPFLSLTRLFQGHRSRGDPVHVMEEDWDTLAILDGCRYDMFERLNTLPGSLESRISAGSATDEFVEENFDAATYNDVVYVTANPRVNVTCRASFHAIINVWDDGWDDDLQTVTPETVSAATLEALERYPAKRIIAHFIQPHAPFIGEFAQRNLGYHSTLTSHRPAEEPSSESKGNIWEQLRSGAVGLSTVKRAYDENLEIVLPEVARILDAESGKIVVTSDHGNLLGERLGPFMRRFYGHPAGLRAKALVRVPWLEHDSGNRREIVGGSVESDGDDAVQEEVIRKLRDLGYA